MQPKQPHYIYWDSCVFLDYIQKTPGRVQIIDDLWREIAQDKDAKIITSTVSIVEVAYSRYEKEQDALDPEVESTIDAMWSNPSILLVEASQPILLMARDLMRDAIPNGWVLKPRDAMHLATAMWVNRNADPVEEFHTYDESLRKYETMIGIHICEPYIQQPSLPMPPSAIED